MRYDVSVIGLYILDVLGRPVTKIPDRGNVEFIDEIKLTVAGTAGGVVVNTAKLGLKSLAVGAVGQDEKADFVIGAMDRLGIDTSAMQSLPGVPTSATILNIRPNGERPALHQRGASDHFDLPEHLYDQVFSAPIVHLGGTGLLRKLDGERSVTLLQEAKRRGRTVTFDLIAASAETAGLVLPLLPYIDYFMPSIEEAQDMSGLTGPEDCAAFYLDKGAKTCVFTLGGDGAFYADAEGTRLRVPAYPIEVVDTTGCGDAFDAGFITALHHRMNPEDAVRFAQGVAALVAGGLGSDAGVRSFDHTQDSVSRWLAQAAS
ncbi:MULTISPECIES: carbohydrate kinase family protein [unclassified Aureimonas]|uniref:carbohydrate kinase family protein n=1 Tax=unclassified Aureimonas TaxID=2615206 RepID=UPI0006F3C080|nr:MULTISPECIES: sugar kinase [unclassified Aureimonas]KQT57356.1 kinase [Aureimonas sp. Leaf427]KQT77034.1 kinase [Aureimonas sp. Leaf460]